MAQRANTPRGTTASPPTVEEVRLALSHFIELAAAFEGRGVALMGGPRDADLNTLTDVTRALLGPRAVQRRSQADLVHGLAVNVLAEAYRGAQNGTQLDLQTRLVEEFGQLGIDLSDADLDQLVVLWAADKNEARLAAIARSNPTTTRAASDSGPEEVTIKGSGGPVEAAKKTLGSVLDRGTRTLHDVKEAVEETPPMRAPFGRWIGTAERHRYVDELRASWLKEPGSAHAALLSGSLGSLKELEEARGDVFDATVEKGALAFLTTAEGLLSIVTAESDSPTLKEAQRQFHERWSSRAKLLLGLIAIAPDLAEERLAELPGVSARVYDAARPLIAAFQTADEAAGKAVLLRFNAAVALDVIESARAHHAERLQSLQSEL